MVIEAVRLTGRRAELDSELRGVDERYERQLSPREQVLDSEWSRLVAGDLPHLTTAARRSEFDAQPFDFFAPATVRSPLALATWIPGIGLISVLLSLVPAVPVTLLAMAIGIVAVVLGVRAHERSLGGGHPVASSAPLVGVMIGASGIMLAAIVFVFTWAAGVTSLWSGAV